MAARTSRPKGAPAVPPPIDEAPDAPVYLLHGGDEFLVATNARALVDRLCPAADQALGLEIIEAQDTATVAEALAALRACLQAVQTVGFFGVQKVVWLRDAVLFGQSRVVQSDDVKAALEPVVQELKRGLPEGIRLVISAPGIDKRSALYRACKERGVTLEYAVPEKAYQVEAQAQERAAELFRREGLTIQAAVLEQFIGKAGTDTRQIAQEVEKLRLYLGEGAEVTGRAIREVVSPAREASSWDFEDAVGTRQVGEALRILRQLLFQGENPIGLIIRLETRFRDLMVLRSCVDRHWCRIVHRGAFAVAEWAEDPQADAYCGQLDRDPRGYHPYRAGRLAEQAGAYRARELVRAADTLLEGHRKMVSSSLPPPLILEFLVLRIAGREA